MGGVPLWVLVGMIDDNPDVGPDHYNFNDSIAAQGYSVKISSGDGWDTTLASADIARNNGYIVANTLNGQPLPVNLTSGKLNWPLHLKGAAVFGGQQVGNITKIELTGLPQPPTEWTLTLQGEVTDTITQSFFIDAIACQHNITWTNRPVARSGRVSPSGTLQVQLMIPNHRVIIPSTIPVQQWDTPSVSLLLTDLMQRLPVQKLLIIMGFSSHTR